MFLLNGTPLGIDSPFTYNDTQYPSNWLRLASQEERAAIGITEEPDAPSFDDRLYWAAGMPKDLEPLKQQKKEQIRQTAYSLLQPSDYKVLRAFEGGTAVDVELLASRAAIRVEANANEALVDAVTTVDELAVLTITWKDSL